MTEGSWILGITLMAFAGWLHRQESEGWPSETFVTDLDKKYHRRRTRSRLRIHLILAGCGVAAIVAAIFGPGRVWVAAWSIVMVSLMTVVMLAGVDALRTQRYLKAKIPEIRRQILDTQESSGKDD